MRIFLIIVSTLGLITNTATGKDNYLLFRSETFKKHIIEERIQTTNTKDFAKWQSLHTANACRTAPEIQGALCGSGHMRAAIENLVASIPNYHLDLVESFGSGLKYTVKIKASGTFTHAMDMGHNVIIPPTGKSFQQEWVALVTFTKQGKISRFEEFYDQLDLYKQLGLMP